MKYDFQMLFLLVMLGVFFKKLNWRGWFFVGLFLFTWMMYNWLKA